MIFLFRWSWDVHFLLPLDTGVPVSQAFGLGPGLHQASWVAQW